MVKIIESVGPAGKHKNIYPVQSTAESIAISFHPTDAAILAAALINASGKCKRGQWVHLTAFRTQGRWTVNIIKSTKK